jgi:hypothetical protein
MADTLLKTSEPVLKLNVIIDGKKYQLESPAFNAPLQNGVTILVPGDYKAKLVQDVHKTPYESLQVYEFMFSDKKTRKFFVVGETE